MSPGTVCSSDLSITVSSSTSHLCVQSTRPRIKHYSTSVGSVAATLVLHFPLVMGSIYSASYAVRLSAPRRLHQKSYSSAPITQNPNKSAAYVVQCSLCDLCVKTLVIAQNALIHNRYATTALRPKAERQFADFSRKSSRCMYPLRKFRV